ncbi:hypothetical protein G6L32_14565 [Agrobacterium tumefaciens]|uniref:hypothetical protein n=1 Tax=Agrobacterium tumefaciens TaxID=358 RepID=UPI001573F67C|nr:hypothetical protein [Agrobacterium tumefaciens]
MSAVSIPGDDGHQVVVVLAGVATEVGVELAVAGVDGEGEVVSAFAVLFLPDAADLVNFIRFNDNNTLSGNIASVAYDLDIFEEEFENSHND